ncbi:sensor histidine kinase [Paraferrimonas sedimenticola]|uniref:histidine kinase n=1 Tax=Paraferrimonas sedimenticola TaxID=375674 RepID=A0AA37RP57_9GAMM|nr:HAMP domain-containing sensor histidine kinase [Paraferrimonas sedimenticola]GLP94793.1 hypothetical protein GCM10007895_00990 [Paraferrimonas sedimenticola]
MNVSLIFIVYLIYGLAFFSIACAIAFRNVGFSNLAITKALPALAVFGLVHAVHEWSEMYWLLRHHHFDPSLWHVGQVWRVIKLVFSYLAMVWFAWLMIDISRVKRSHLFKSAIVAVLFSYVALMYRHWNLLDSQEYVSQAALITRWVFGFGASTLAGILLIVYGGNKQSKGLDGGRYFAYCGIALGCYGIAAGILKADYGLWVPMLRTTMALAMLVFLIQALKVFDEERERQIAAQLTRAMKAEKLNAIGQLTTGIAHEIKTPLANATLALDLVERQPSLEDAKPLLGRIKKSLSRASHISQEVLQFGRQKKTEFEAVDLSKVVASTLDLLAFRARQYRIINSVVEPVWVHGDPIKLEEVLVNLIGNAMDASEPGGRISLFVEQCDERVRLCVRDNGPGIEPHELEKAFTPFYTSKPAGQGTGLGLVISREIVEQHLGELSLENHASGLQAWVCLPGGSET